jgi:serine/threonine protein kinase
MARKIYDVVSPIAHGDSKGQRREFKIGERVTWRDFDDDETQGRHWLNEVVRSGAVRERDLDAEEIAMVGRKGGWQPLERLGKGGQGTAYKAVNVGRLDLKGAATDLYRGLFPFRDMGSMRENPEELIAQIQRALSSFHAAADPSSFGALKVLHSSDDPAADRQARARMEAEVKVYESVSHPSLLKLLDRNIEEGWLVTDFQQHGTLESASERFRGDVLGALEAIRPLVEAVAALHAKGMVHRDIKPGNVFLGADGRLILGDAGLVFFLEDHGHTRVSETLENVGSRDWMPLYAEGQRWEDVNKCFDVFSLGKLLWAMIAGLPKVRARYYEFDPKLKLETLFPGDEDAAAVGALLAGTVVAHEEEHRIRDASGLQEAMSSLAEVVRGHRCLSCLKGGYVEDKSVGPGFMGGAVASVCARCGHVQLRRPRPSAESREAGA